MPQVRPSDIIVFGPDTVIYAQGDSAGPLYLLEYGTLRLCRVTAYGRRQISAFILAGEVFGLEAGSEHHLQAESIETSGVRLLCPSFSEISSGTLLDLALRSLTQAQEQLLVLGRQTARERVAAFLLDLSQRQGTARRVRLSMTRYDIADYLGMAFETVSRVFGRLNAAGLIRVVDHHEVHLLQPDTLHALCE